MSSNIKDYLDLLEDNEENIKKEAKRILIKICYNILKDPQDPRFRKIFLSNTLVSKKLLPATGAIQCLFAVGFIEDDNGFLLPNNASLSRVKELYDHLNGAPQQLPNPQPVLNQSTNVRAPIATTSTANLPDIQEENERKRINEKNFFIRLLGYFKDVLKYEEEYLQDKAKQLLPLASLQLQAMKKMRILDKQSKANKLQNPLVYEDLVVFEMMIWFKTKFFSWIDSPECDRCTGRCKFNRIVRSYHRKISRIEIHECTVCGDENQFPRYSDPECLLFTRKGRCGEWANCFALFCRVAKFDTRVVFDETDHVWVEVWSDFHGRWIHVDPCENAMDTPLMYEKGWNKKLSYIIAFSKDEIVDVSWRYTSDYKNIMKNRNICSEESLILFMQRLNRQRQTEEGYNPLRRKYVNVRKVKELASFLTAPPGFKKNNEECAPGIKYGSRQSGSLAWKIARGEVDDTTIAPFQWKIPKDRSCYELSYYIVKDAYVVKDLEKKKIALTKTKWRTGVDTIEGGIFRKEERDWKMVYLARLPVNDTSKITWTISVEDKDLACIDTVKFRAVTATFKGATITWEIKGIICGKDTSEDVVKVLPIPNSENFQTGDLSGARQIEISATLSGGDGEQSWQHAQLFRESITSTSLVPSMTIKISLMQKV